MSKNFLMNLLATIKEKDKILNLIQDEEKKYHEIISFLSEIRNELQEISSSPNIKEEISGVIDFIEQKNLLTKTISNLENKNNEKSELLTYLKLSDTEAESKLNKNFTKKNLVVLASKDSLNIPERLNKAPYIKRMIKLGREKWNISKLSGRTVIKENKNYRRELSEILFLDDKNAALKLTNKSIRELNMLAESSSLEISKGLGKEDLIHKILSQGRIDDQLNIISSSSSSSQRFHNDSHKFFESFTEFSNNRFQFLEIPKRSKIPVDFQIIWRDKISYSIWVEIKYNIKSIMHLFDYIKKSNVLPLLIILNSTVSRNLVEELRNQLPERISVYQFSNDANLTSDLERFYDFISHKCLNWF